MTAYQELFDLAREYLQDLAASGYESEAAAEFAAATAPDALPEALGAAFRLFECNAVERAAVIFSLAMTLDAGAASAAERLGCPDAGITPQFLCAAMLGTDSIAEASVLFDEDGVLAKLFDGVSPAWNARMTLRRSMREVLLHGSAPR